jgi:hypothetical protein
MSATFIGLHLFSAVRIRIALGHPSVVTCDMVIFATDDDLAYRWDAIELRPTAGADHILSREYRTMQLPLVRPTHPDVISHDTSSGYDRFGHYNKPRISVIGFVPFNVLDASPVFHRIMNAVAMTSASAKIDWALVERRRYRHHFTISGRLNDSMPDDEVVPFVQERLAGLRSFRVQLKGPWLWGNKNGRIYFPVYPQIVPGSDGNNYLSDVQLRLGTSPHPGFYVGCLQLTDHLNWSHDFEVNEADDLFGALAPFREEVVAEFDVEQLAVHRTHDDLILESRVLERIDLDR